jgi:hypothetical protein
MPVPPLDPNWKPPENPNNPPLPRDWKPAPNPNNPPLPQDWAPPGGLPARPMSKPKTPTQSVPRGAVSEDGYYMGTNIKAWSPENDPLGLGNIGQRSPSYNQPQVDPATGRMGASQAFRDRQAQLPWMQNRPQQPTGPTPDQFYAGPGMPQQPGGMQMPQQMQGEQPMGQPPMQQQRPWNPLMPTSPTNMPPEMTQQDIDRYNYDLQGGRFGKADQAAQMHQGYTETAYHDAYNQLEKARQSVMVDQRFSPEQRQQALEKIAARADELDQGYMAAKPLERSPMGMDAPPPEEFSELQEGTGLQSMQDGRFRNPDTGDVMRAVRAPNGQIVPLPTTQSEIDALPPGTRYIDRTSGKLVVTPDASGGGRGRAGTTPSGGRASAGAEAPMTSEDAFAAYEKWSKGVDPGTTQEERKVISDAIALVQDPDAQQELMDIAKSDPQAALDMLQSQGVDLTGQLEQARISAFASDRKSRSERTKKVAEALGIQEPETKKPAIDSTKYRREVGTRGTMQIRRRGSDIAIPAITGPDGETYAAPRQMRQLADLEVDTEFANIIPDENGLEVRTLPFGKQTVNLGNFALTDAQRKAFASEAAQIRARSPEEWSKFEDLLQKFQTTDEMFDPKNPTAAQSQLQEIVSNYYDELGPAGKAMMTMYIAHSLGYRVDKNRGFGSTGWAKDVSKGNRDPGTAGINLPTSNVAGDLAQKLYKIGFLDESVDVLEAGGGRTKEYEQNLNDMAKNIWNISHEMEGRALSGAERGSFGNKYQQIDRMVESVANQNGFGNSLKGRLIIQDLRKRLNSWVEQTAPKAAQKPSAPAPATRQAPAQTPRQAAPQAPAAPTPAQPDRRDEMVKGFGQAWGRQRGILPEEPKPQAPSEWKPEEPTLMDRTFGIDSPGLLPKKQLWGEYQRLQDQVAKMQERRDRYKSDPTSNRDLSDAKRELQEFIKTKGESFKQRNKNR